MKALFSTCVYLTLWNYEKTEYFEIKGIFGDKIERNFCKNIVGILEPP